MVYGVLAVFMLTYLPPVKDMSWAAHPLGLLGSMVGNARELWRALVGITITALAWLICARRLSCLRATDALHSGIVLVQTGFACFFIYFAICDPLLRGGATPRALQCAMIAIASACGQLGWWYARRRGLLDPETPPRQADQIAARGWLETLSALVIAPLSWIGPVTWTVGWIVAPAMLLLGVPWIRARLAPGRAAAT